MHYTIKGTNYLFENRDSAVEFASHTEGEVVDVQDREEWVHSLLELGFTDVARVSLFEV